MSHRGGGESPAPPRFRSALHEEGLLKPPDRSTHLAADLSDDELDRYILTRLALAGVDLDVLPEDDPEAPVDRARVLRSARAFLRTTLPELSAWRPSEGTVPAFYPPLHPGATGGSDGGR